MSNASAHSSRRFQVGDTVITDDSLPFVIAEIGNNHQGDVEIAKQMIRAAAFTGASAVKFQKRDNQTLFTKEAFDAPYAKTLLGRPTVPTARHSSLAKTSTSSASLRRSATTLFSLQPPGISPVLISWLT